MKPSLLYRIVSILLVLFSAGHTLGFRTTDARWKIDAIVASMKAVHFDVEGFNRTYWDFYVGFGLFVSVFLLFAAILAWQLGSLPQETLGRMTLLTWTFAICFVGITFLSWQYFFLTPVLFSVVITLCLLLAAWLSPRPN